MANVGINKVVIVGNVGADPEVKTLSGGKVANFRIATGEKWRDKNTGERREKTEWHSIVVWGDALVAVVDDYVRKGSRVGVIGQLQTRKYEKNGEDRYVTEIVIKGFGGELTLLDSRKDDDRGDRRESRRDDSRSDRRDDRRDSDRDDRRGSGGTGRAHSRRDDLDDDIPF